MIRLAILRILESYFRHRWLYLVPIVLLTVVGAASALLAERRYIASGVIYVQKESFLGALTNLRDVPFSYKTPAQETAEQIMNLMQTDAYVRSVIQDTKLEESMNQGDAVVSQVMDETRSSIWTQTIGDNQVVIYATRTDPLLAFELSNAVVNRYVQWQINLDQIQSGAAEEFLDELVITYEAELEEARADLQKYLVANPEPLRGDRSEEQALEIDRLQSILSLAGQRYSRALEQQEGARLATAQAEADVRQTYFVVDAPVIPSSPAVSLRQQAVGSIVFVVVGVMLSGVAIAGAAVLDRSFRFPLDVAQGLALPVLSMVPDVSPKSARLAFLRRRADKPTVEKAGQKMRGSLAEDEAVEAAV